MPCYKPIHGWRAKYVNKESGKRPVVFRLQDGIQELPVTLPCGRCMGCRLEYSRQWAIRIVNHASCFDSNSFVNLTFDNENLPDNLSLDLDYFQKFMKRFRRSYERKNGKTKISYFHCGEYGEATADNGWIARPHYHVIIFNVSFPDRKFLKFSPSGFPLYTSEYLGKIWTFGNHTLGDVTFESAAYVARYCTKKITKGNNGFGLSEEDVNSHYMQVDKSTGEILSEKIKPEYCTMSKRPPIGGLFYEKYKDEIYKSDSLIVNGKEVKPPSFYDRRFCLDYPLESLMIKDKRRKERKKVEGDNLYVKEKICKARMGLNKKSLENEQ